MYEAKRTALLEWLQSQLDAFTVQGGNTIDLPDDDSVSVVQAEIVDDAVLVEFSNGETAAFTVEEV